MYTIIYRHLETNEFHTVNVKAESMPAAEIEGWKRIKKIFQPIYALDLDQEQVEEVSEAEEE
jgi:hypothetical protein